MSVKATITVSPEVLTCLAAQSLSYEHLVGEIALEQFLADCRITAALDELADEIESATERLRAKDGGA